MIEGMIYKHGPSWWVKFRDHRRIPRRLRAGRSRDNAIGLERTLVRLADAVASNKPVPDDIAQWINDKIDEPRLERLIAWGIIDQRRLMAGRPLTEHLDDWQEYLESKGNTDRHARKISMRARAVLNAVPALAYGDITGERVARAIKGLSLSQSTANGYLTAIKGFCKWMVDHGRTATAPPGMALLKRQKVTEPQIARRALTDDEIARLMKAPAARRIVYAMALQTGLRANEIRTLPVAAFDLDRAVFTVQAKNTKAKKDVTLPVEPQLLAELRKWLKRRKSQTLAFDVPERSAEMVQQDLGTRDVDFHCLRHTFGTRLARAGVHPRTAQRLMRHSSIELTMRFYTHLQMSDDVQAVAKLGGICDPQCAPKRAKLA